VDECMEKVLATQKSGLTADPAGARKKLVDAFATVGVKAADLMEYLGGQTLDGLTEDQFLELTSTLAGVKTGELKWIEALEASPYRIIAEGAEAPKQNEKTAGVRQKIEDRKAAARQQREAAKKPAAAPAPEPQPTPPSEPTKPAREPGED
jgi:hypothetical protein